MAVERNPLEALEPELKEEMPVSNFDVRGDTPSIEAEMMEDNIINFMPTDDGGVEVEFGEIEEMVISGPMGSHFENLAEHLSEEDLTEIGQTVYDSYEADKESREEWEQIFERGFDLLGLKLEETTEPFDGACTAVHPLLIESVVKFQSKASQELFPAGGPVKAQIIGASTIEREKQAQRVKNFMNYQLTQQMPEYFEEQERLLFHLPVMGSAFKKIYYDQLLERPVSELVPVDHFYVSYNAKDLRTADRYTHLIFRSVNDYKKDVVSGMYLDIDLGKPSAPDIPEMTQKMDEIMGIASSGMDLEDPQYVLLEQHCYLDLPEPYNDPDGIAHPYIVTIEEKSQKVLCIRRNYKENDPKQEKKLHFIHYKYVPGFGFYGLGLIHFLGNLTMTATTAMRSLVDAGQFANLPGGFKARGVRLVGDNEPISPGEFKEVESTGIDLNKAIITLPYKEPSQTLMAMMQFVIGAGQKFADSTEQVIADSKNSGPVGTTMALLEASSKFFSAIHKRLHKAQKDEFEVLAQINYDYLPPAYPYEVVGGDQEVFKQDFDGRIDVIPVSDPNIPSSAHRMALGQLAIQLASQTPPGTFNMPALYREVLTAANFPNLDEILPPEQKPEPRDPLADIIAATKGLPIAAFPGQNHEAHIQFKTSFLKDPATGANPMMKQIVPVINANIRDHMIMKYQEQVLGLVKASGVANDPQTTEMVMAQAAEEVANANAAMGIAQSPEQQMLLLEKERLELDRQKAEMEAAKDSADIALKQMDMQLRGKENMNDMVMNVGKMEADERKDNLKALEATAKLELEKQKLDDDSELKAANTAIQTLQAVSKKLGG
tara:strand:+ start:255 stop:2747 length:2493 start_codon:yes stop_codon:yes gene_type:complete